MMPADLEARIYFVVLIVLAGFTLLVLWVAISALRAVDRADRRARRAEIAADLLTGRLESANRALEHWKQTDRQRTATGWVLPTGVAHTQLPQIFELPDRPNLRDDTGAIT